MNFPINDGGVASGLLCGVLFGYVLENAGFGSPCKLTAQFQLRDWSVFKVMFTAIVVTAVGLFLFEAGGWLKPDDVFIPTTYFWATLLGGALIGAGFSTGGYCPGTSVVALASGRVDAVVFMLGLVVGTGGFASVYDSLGSLMEMGKGPDGQTLPDLLGLPQSVVLGGLILAAVGGFALAKRLEQRSKGPLNAEETLSYREPH